MELDDRQEMVWVWQDLPKSTHNELCTHLTQDVRENVQLGKHCRRGKDATNPKEQQCYCVGHDYEISMKYDVDGSWRMKDA